jgi:hypothetical protein
LPPAPPRRCELQRAACQTRQRARRSRADRVERLGKFLGKEREHPERLGIFCGESASTKHASRWGEFSTTGKRGIFVSIAGAAGGLGATRVRKARDNRKSEFRLFLRARSHMATYPSNRATVALLLRRCKSFGTRYVWPCGRVTGPQGHLSTLFRRFARADRKSVILLLHKATVGL